MRHEQVLPKTAAERRSLLARVEEVFAGVEREGSSVPAHEIDELLLLSSWFRRFPDELAHTHAPATYAVADMRPATRPAPVARRRSA